MSNLAWWTLTHHIWIYVNVNDFWKFERDSLYKAIVWLKNIQHDSIYMNFFIYFMVILYQFCISKGQFTQIVWWFVVSNLHEFLPTAEYIYIYTHKYIQYRELNNMGKSLRRSAWKFCLKSYFVAMQGGKISHVGFGKKWQFIFAWTVPSRCKWGIWDMQNSKITK